MRITFSTILFLTLLVSRPAPGANDGSTPRELWLYYPTNLQVAENVDKAEAIWKRAAAAGYTHVLLADSKFSKLGDVPDFYFKNVERMKGVAAGLKLKLVPAVFPVGYSNEMLWHDPNLAEGLPVRDAPFVVRNGRAELVHDPAVSLAKVGYKDDSISIDGNVATVPETGENARLTFNLKVPKFRCYHVSVMVKTEDLRGKPEVKALGGERSLNWASLGVKPTQDWTEHHAVFNSLDNEEVNVYLGVWGGVKGSLRWKNWKIEEVGPVNVLRRPGTPVSVRGEDGKAYAEGTDFERIEDPHMGNDPWPGEYHPWHEPPAIRTKLPDGTRLRVSWYHPAVIYDGQVSACIAEPKFADLLADQAKRMKATWGESAAGYMMSHDEFRTLGWCKACEGAKQTPGQLLAANVKACRALLNPSAAYVWNDMFDPHHNAVPGPYYLVNGPWTDAWAGLGADVVIMNWNFGERDKSLKFFADRGHRQIIAGYYDNDLSEMRQWLASAKDTKGVIGCMYTTWRNDYDQIEAFAKLCQDAVR